MSRTTPIHQGDMDYNLDQPDPPPSTKKIDHSYLTKYGRVNGWPIEFTWTTDRILQFARSDTERARTGKIKWGTVLARLYEIRKLSKDNNLLPSDPELVFLFSSDLLVEIRAGVAKEERDKKAAKARPQPSPTLSTTTTISSSSQPTVFYGVYVLVEYAYSQSWIPAFGDWMSALFPLSQHYLFEWLESIARRESSIVNSPSALSVYLGDVEALQR
jgi:hypothetical protein